MSDHDPLCPFPDSRYIDWGCQCALVARVRAEEQRHAEMARAVDHIALLERWRDDAHSVLFNHGHDDLTPQQRVWKWLDEVQA
jgi:hypothetical protein